MRLSISRTCKSYLRTNNRSMYMGISLVAQARTTLEAAEISLKTKQWAMGMRTIIAHSSDDSPFEILPTFHPAWAFCHLLKR
ncbi:hypothetical protein GOP47_0011062 [Adiantum capillus-veneris]|uniref:Uncharacterized protein n=1 Tax=Adiantum capillus-veneris TaxID=13818 RepID=A0A9D4USH0_ADICA|nr:hypothetical protein GOP47_0011062 [Adiantum capillus-veneris]